MIEVRPAVEQALRARSEPRVTFVRAGGLGDTLLVLPAMQLVLRHRPAARLTLVGSSWAGQLRELVAFPLRIIRFDAPELAPLFGEQARGDLTGALSGADVVVIYARRPDEALVRNARRLCDGTVIDWPVEPEGTAHASLHFARAVADATIEDLPAPAINAAAEPDDRARAWLDARLPAGRPLAIHPGSGGRRKCWSPEGFARIAMDRGGPVLLVEGPADAGACAAFRDALGGRLPLAVARGLDLGPLARLLGRCAAYVGNDSGVSHLAAALGVPCVAVFGRTDPFVWAPRGARARAVGRANAWPDPSEVAAAIEDVAR